MNLRRSKLVFSAGREQETKELVSYRPKRLLNGRMEVMQRVGFRLKLRMEKMDEYVDRHATVWPDMLQALRDTGWHNYSLFLDRNDGAIFGYVETPDLESARAGMASLEVNQRWQKEMAPFFEALDDLNPDEGIIQMESVFYLA